IRTPEIMSLNTDNLNRGYGHADPSRRDGSPHECGPSDRQMLATMRREISELKAEIERLKESELTWAGSSSTWSDRAHEAAETCHALLDKIEAANNEVDESAADWPVLTPYEVAQYRERLANIGLPNATIIRERGK